MYCLFSKCSLLLLNLGKVIIDLGVHRFVLIFFFFKMVFFLIQFFFYFFKIDKLVFIFIFILMWLFRQ